MARALGWEDEQEEGRRRMRRRPDPSLPVVNQLRNLILHRTVLLSHSLDTTEHDLSRS